LTQQKQAAWADAGWLLLILLPLLLILLPLLMLLPLLLMLMLMPLMVEVEESGSSSNCCC
jgi:hypothetical protein